MKFDKPRYVICCPKCYSSNIRRDEYRIKETGKDYFMCRDCKHKFPYAKSTYTLE